MSNLSELNEQELSRQTRPDLEAFAVEQGLTDVATYANKPAVLDALKRVKAGEDAATVNGELKVVVDDAPDAPAGPAVTDNGDENGDDGESASDDRPAAHNRNLGHPTEFDETGAPIYR